MVTLIVPSYPQGLGYSESSFSWDKSGTSGVSDTGRIPDGTVPRSVRRPPRGCLLQPAPGPKSSFGGSCVPTSDDSDYHDVRGSLRWKRCWCAASNSIVETDLCAK